MNEAEAAFRELAGALTARDAVSMGQMFGKACIKVGRKAFVAQQGDYVVFKLRQPEHAAALATAGAVLWDPSGKGRPMREWVAMLAAQRKRFPACADAAYAFVKELA